MPPPIATQITCERSGHWASQLRCVAAERLARITLVMRETRSPAECLEALAEAPGSAVWIAWTPNQAQACARLLYQIERRFPAARVVMLAAPSERRHEPLWRSLGAHDAAYALWELGASLEASLRHVERGAPKRSSPLEEALGRLPW